MSATASLGRREVLLEDLTGLPAVDAIARLRELELRPAVEGCETDEGDEHGLVLAQEPSADSAVRRAQLIRLVVGQRAENARRQCAHQSRLPRRGGANENRSELKVEAEPESPIAAAHQAPSDREHPRGAAIRPSERASANMRSAREDQVGTSVDALLDPPAGVAPGTARPGSPSDGETRVGRGRPTSSRVIRAACATALLAAGLIVPTIVSVTGLHEVRKHRPGIEATLRRSPPMRTPAHPTRSSTARGSVARARPARRRKTAVHHPRRRPAADAVATQPFSAPRQAHTGPSSSPPSIASPAPAQLLARSRPAVSSLPASVLPPSPTGPLPGPPPT
jgi:PASTA domain